MNAHVSQGGWPVLVLNADFRPLSYVVSLKSFVRPTTHPAFTRFNVFLRDRFGGMRQSGKAQ